jgi:alpha-glucosidase
VTAGSDTVVAPSPLGFELKDAPPMRAGFEVLRRSTRRVDETWTPVWGPDSLVVNRFRELTVQPREAEAPRRRLDLVFRAYDDGVASRSGGPSSPISTRST